jgi:hypothetical protein
MRKLVIMRGPQGSGKSTLLERTGLSWYTISPDDIRRTVGGLRLAPHGGWTVNQDDNPYVWSIATHNLERRIAAGETIAFDATFPLANEIETIANIGRNAGYDVLIVDRWSCDREKAFAYNAARGERRRVPRGSFDKFCAQADTTRALDPTLRILSTGDDLDASEKGILEFLEEGMDLVDLSHYDRVLHIGDLQGCLSPVIDASSPVMRWMDDPKTFMICVGDILDRGIENGEVLRWWLDNMVGRPNTVTLAGNHEDHIEIEAAGRPPVSREFAKRTLPQLHRAGITREDLGTIAASLGTHMAYRWRGKGVLVTHAGLGSWPQPMWGVPTTQYRKGAGRYQTPVDDVWASWSASDEAKDLAVRYGVEELWQVHGHRNQRMLPVIAAERSINLEGQVEFGGHLRYAVLDESGWTPVMVRNRIHNTMQEFAMNDMEDQRQGHGGTAPLAPWAAKGETGVNAITRERFESIRDDEMVFESVSATHPHISAFNFSKQAFWGKHWTTMTTHTRGLFMNTTSLTIAARSYPKFFNRGERRETKDETLSQDLKFPVTAYVKENGFLGITGYDDATGELVVASKSRMDGDFAGWFREILAETLGEAGMEKLLRFNRDQMASCTFEVVDPVNDPHIIEERTRRVILLDAIHRDEEFSWMPYPDLVKLASHLGCEVKQVAFRNIEDWPTLQRILDRIETDETWRPNRGSGPVEGVVVEDAEGFMFKVKALFYARWKRARYGKDRVALVRRNESKSLDIHRYEDDPVLDAFVRWCDRQTDEVLTWDIVKLRKAYLADPEALIDGGQAPVADVIPNQDGFIRGVDAIAAQIEAGTAKIGSLIKLLDRSEEDVFRQAAFDAHPAAQRIRDLVEEHRRAEFMANRGAFADIDEEVVAKLRKADEDHGETVH